MVTRTRLKRTSKIVSVNFNDVKSILKAERMKIALENKGYNLKSTKRMGLDKYALTYKKK